MQRPSGRWRRRPGRLGAILVVLFVGVALPVVAGGPAPVPAQAASAEDEQQRLREEEQAKTAEIDALTADAADVEAAITALDADVADQRQRADRAESEVRSVQAQLAAASARQASTEAARTLLRRELQDVALAAYVRPPSEDLAVVLADEDPSADAKRKVMAATRTRAVADVLDELRGATERARRAGVLAAAALAAAEAALAAERQALADLDSSLTAQQQLADDVQARLDRALSEAAAISSRSAQLAAEITAREQALAARVGPPSGGTRPAWTSSGVRVTTVRGIEVAVEIADELDALMGAAAAAGIFLDGSGYRDISTQIEIRREHCGTSEYAIWEMPSTDCSPPVARPGYSMHERGLAVDFIVGGDLIRSRSTAAFRWLSANASSYGFYNLPSEPWHWSTTGS